MSAQFIERLPDRVRELVTELCAAIGVERGRPGPPTSRGVTSPPRSGVGVSSVPSAERGSTWKHCRRRTLCARTKPEQVVHALDNYAVEFTLAALTPVGTAGLCLRCPPS